MARHRHHVYVVLLDDVVMNDRRFASANPGWNPARPCVYVGMTGLTPELRLARHKAGAKANRFVREHGLASSSVSDVEVTRDMAHAKVFVTVLQPERALDTVKALKTLAPEIRYQLAHAMRLRHVPELHFHYDESVDRGERIDNLLRDLRPSGCAE